MGGEAAARGTPAAWALVVTTAPDHARRANWWAALLLAVAVGWHLAPLYTPPFASEAIVGSDTYRSHDWLEVAKLDFYARKSLLQWHSLPLWNPLLAGGQPQFSHPSDGSMGPLILASVLFGEVLGMKINVGLAALLGAWGVLFLLRSGLGLGISAAFVGALGYAWSGWLPARVAVGFYESSLVVAWPAVLALWLMPGPLAARRRRWTLAAVVVWALSVQLQTGRTHQIRRHAADQGFPVAGDRRYGGAAGGLWPRLALHACTLALTHPITEEALSLSAPIPEDLASLWAQALPHPDSQAP